MKIKLRVSKALSRDELVARLPDMVAQATQAILEKGRAVAAEAAKHAQELHPNPAVAAVERQALSEGDGMLDGVMAWLLRQLKVEAVHKGLGQDDYQDGFLEAHGVQLGSTVTYAQACELDKILDVVPNEVLDGGVRLISVDGRFGASKSKYPNHGRYYDEAHKILLNPNIFGEKTEFTSDQGEKLLKVQHTLLHEVGHSIDDRYGFSAKKEWLALSGWRYIGDEEPPQGYERLHLKEDGRTTLKGIWAYKKGTEFCRWYGARNPKEDFCECFSFAAMNAKHYFKGENGHAKLKFVEKIVARLLKSESPVTDLTDAEDTLVKAGAAFQEEVCEDLALEKAEPEGWPSAAEPNPLKGQIKPGHKYLYFDQLPDGERRYHYKMPNGQHYTSPEPLHDEGRHQPEYKTPGDWNQYQMESMPPGPLPEVQAGMGTQPHFYDQFDDAAPLPDLVDPVTGQEEGLKPEPWRTTGVEAAQEALTLHPDDAQQVEQSLAARDVVDMDEDFEEQLGKHMDLVYKVHLDKSCDAICKPEGEDRPGFSINPKTAPHREVLAYHINKVLGWQLVPPTVLRELAGPGMRLVQDRVAAAKYLTIQVSKKTLTSLQYFVDEACNVSKAPHLLAQVALQEKIRFAAFDMVINAQDRHFGNVMLVKDVDAAQRYGGEYRLVAVDHGQSFGDGWHTNNVFYDKIKAEVVGKPMAPAMVVDLQRLRTALKGDHLQQAASAQVLGGLTANQLARVGQRLDFLLAPEHQDAQGRQTLPSWEALEAWEDQQHLQKAMAACEDPDFDVMGGTSWLGVPEAQQPGPFTDEHEARAWLHPLLDLLLPSQKAPLELALTTMKEEPNLTALALLDAMMCWPKRLVNQAFVKQNLPRRFGLGQHGRTVLRAARTYLALNLKVEAETVIKAADVEAYNKLRRGELTQELLRKLVGKEAYETMEQRWLFPLNLMQVDHTKEAKLFDEPEHFDWAPPQTEEPAQAPEAEPRLVVGG